MTVRGLITLLLKGVSIPDEYIDDINKAVNILNNEGCKDVYLFGSLVKGKATTLSDIDIAVRICPDGKYFNILGKLMMELNHPVDFIVLDERDDFANFIKDNGELVYVS